MHIKGTLPKNMHEALHIFDIISSNMHSGGKGGARNEGKQKRLPHVGI